MTIYTLSMIKPDATRRGLVDEMTACLKEAGFEVVAQRRMRLTRPQAEHFYAVHKERGFFDEMIQEIISGDVVAYILKKENAVDEHRKVIGATDPAQSGNDTIRGKFGLSIGQNSIHGSDSDENADAEISFFFGAVDKLS